jgi:hypothetical protein
MCSVFKRFLKGISFHKYLATEIMKHQIQPAMEEDIPSLFENMEEDSSSSQGPS